MTSGGARIVVNALSSLAGGGVTYINNLLGGLRSEDDAEVYLLAAPSQKPLIPSGPFTLVECEWAGRSVMNRVLWERFALPRLLRRLRANVYFVPAGGLTTRVPNGCSTVVAFRNLLPFSPYHRRRYPLGYMRSRYFLLRYLHAWSFSHATLVICISRHGRSVILPFLRDPEHSSVVIPHGVSDDFFPRENARLPAPDLPESYVLYVSVLNFYKAQIEVLEAWSRLRAIRNTPEKLVLVGPEFPPYGHQVRRRIAELDLDDEVIVTGPVPHQELPALYQNAKVNIFASRCENCPNILLESLASGRPVISSSDPPMPEFGEDAVAYFDPADPEQLTRLLLEILDDPVRLEQMELDAKRQAEKFSLDRAVRTTWEHLFGLAARAPDDR